MSDYADFYQLPIGSTDSVKWIGQGNLERFGLEDSVLYFQLLAKLNNFAIIRKDWLATIYLWGPQG